MVVTSEDQAPVIRGGTFHSGPGSRRGSRVIGERGGIPGQSARGPRGPRLVSVRVWRERDLGSRAFAVLSGGVQG